MFAKTKSTMLIVLVILAVAGSSAGVFAQATDGNIVGTVTDATQAVIPGAMITATNKATGITLYRYVERRWRLPDQQSPGRHHMISTLGLAE